MEVQAALATAAMDNLRREYEAVLKREAKDAERDMADQLRVYPASCSADRAVLSEGGKKMHFFYKNSFSLCSVFQAKISLSSLSLKCRG